jgi:hypothetical protein
MFWLLGGCLVYNSISFFNFSIIFLIFSTTFNILNTIWIITSFNCKCPLKCVHTSHWPYGYSPFRYAYGNKHMGTHDVIHNTFAIIVQNVNFHMGWEQLHALSLTTFKSYHWRVNIVFTKDEICTSVDIVIIDQCEWIYSLALVQLKDLLPLMQLKLNKGVITSNISIFFLNNWNMWMFTQTS